MWEQLKKPNLDPYVYQNGRVLTSWLGWCLAYVQTAFGAGWAGSSAWDAWSNRLSKKHTNRNWPLNVYFPIWFDGYWNGNRYGHVAIALWNGKSLQIWSTPITNKPTFDKWSTIEQVEANYGMKYVGWSEDIGGTNVIKWVAGTPASTTGGTVMTPNFIRRVYYMVMNANPSQKDVDFHMAKSNPESFINGFGDTPLWKTLEGQRNTAISERDAARKRVLELEKELLAERAKAPTKEAAPAATAELTQEQKDAFQLVSLLKNIFK